jgi:hypothetical protein
MGGGGFEDIVQGIHNIGQVIRGQAREHEGEGEADYAVAAKVVLHGPQVPGRRGLV